MGAREEPRGDQIGQAQVARVQSVLEGSQRVAISGHVPMRSRSAGFV
jgi:hypothetical protein